LRCGPGFWCLAKFPARRNKVFLAVFFEKLHFFEKLARP